MPTLQTILERCSNHLPPCHQRKVIEIDQGLADGTPYTKLGGKRLRRSRSIVRFKIGRGWRLVYLDDCGVLVPHALVTRQHFDQLLMRRRKQH